MDPLLILLFLILFLLSAFFSGTEIALMSLAKHKINSLVNSKKYWTKSLKFIKKYNDRLLITILIWNNLVNVYTAALATQIAMSFAEKTNLPEAQAIWIATWIITFLLLLFWEIIPKSFATKNSENISLFVAPIYRFLMFILFPIVYIIEFIIKLFSGKNKVENITNEEIESFIDMWRDEWWLDENEHWKIKSILEFDETTVEEIMTPRVKIDAISSNFTVKEAIFFFLSHTHSRIPVYIETIDKIDFFVTARDLMKEYTKWNLDKKLKDFPLKPVLKVPLNQSIEKLLNTLQKSHKILSIVIDEYGWVAGLVTMEDIIEEVFWEIRDETDKEADEFIKVWKNIFVSQSDALIEDVLENFNLKLADIWLDEKEFDWENLSYVITNILEEFPNKNQIIELKVKKEDLEWKILSFKILEINDAKIWKVEVKM